MSNQFSWLIDFRFRFNQLMIKWRDLCSSIVKSWIFHASSTDQVIYSLDTVWNNMLDADVKFNIEYSRTCAYSIKSSVLTFSRILKKFYTIHFKWKESYQWFGWKENPFTIYLEKQFVSMTRIPQTNRRFSYKNRQLFERGIQRRCSLRWQH